MSITVASAVVWALVSLAAQLTAQQPVLPDVQKLGPQVGSRVPDFTLLDQKGRSRTLASLTGPKGLNVLIDPSPQAQPALKHVLSFKIKGDLQDLHSVPKRRSSARRL